MSTALIAGLSAVVSALLAFRFGKRVGKAVAYSRIMPYLDGLIIAYRESAGVSIPTFNEYQADPDFWDTVNEGLK